MEIPFVLNASAYFHCCRSARWFAPFFARTFNVKAYGFFGIRHFQNARRFINLPARMVTAESLYYRLQRPQVARLDGVRNEIHMTNESDDVSSNKLRAECKRILKPLKNCSHILLACTLYPAIIYIMKDFVSPGTIFIDPSAALVDKIKN